MRSTLVYVALALAAVGCTSSSMDAIGTSEAAATTTALASVFPGSFRAVPKDRFDEKPTPCTTYTKVEIRRDEELGRGVAVLEEVSEGDCGKPADSDVRTYVLTRDSFGVDVDDDGNVVRDWNQTQCGARSYHGERVGGEVGDLLLLTEYRSFEDRGPTCKAPPAEGVTLTFLEMSHDFAPSEEHYGTDLRCDLSAREAASPKLRYVADRSACAAILFQCEEHSYYFADECGCGCKDD